MALTPRSEPKTALRVGGDRLQHALAVLVDQPFGPGGADVAQRGEVGDLPLAVGGVERQRSLCAQLAPVAGVGLPLAADFGPVAGAEVGDRPDQGEALAGLGLLHLEHRVAVVLGAEDHPEHLDRRRVGGRVGVEKGRGARSHLKASRRRGGIPARADVASADGRHGTLRQLPHQRLVPNTRGSVFSLCERSRTDPRFPRYPRVPVAQLPAASSRGRGPSRAPAPSALGLARRHRVGLAELGDLGRLVGLARIAAEDEHADAVGARPDLALGSRADPGDVVGVEREALAVDLDLAAAAQGQVDLLLAVLVVVVFGVVLVVGGMSMICMPNDSTPSSARARLKAPP